MYYIAEKEKLLQMLSKDEIKMIKKDYPFKQERKAKIREILKKGFSYKLLSEVTGLSYCYVWNIGLSSPNANKLSRKGLIKMKEALDKLSEEISIILRDDNKNE